MAKLSATALIIASLSVLGELLGGYGIHLDWFDFRTGLKCFFIAGQAGLYTAIVAALLAAVLLLRKARIRSVAMAVVAIVAGAAAYFPIYAFKAKAMSVPAIHDISTDTSNPPTFVKITPEMRGAGSNPIEYDGPEIATQQLKAYPDVKPLELRKPTSQEFPRLLKAAKALGWQIVDADPVAGRIEATDTTPFFGFKDDIVVRVHDLMGHSLVDVRSVSRVGRSDVGANAARIRRYFARIAD